MQQTFIVGKKGISSFAVYISINMNQWRLSEEVFGSSAHHEAACIL